MQQRYSPITPPILGPQEHCMASHTGPISGAEDSPHCPVLHMRRLDDALQSVIRMHVEYVAAGLGS